MRNIIYITGTRADYGLMRQTLFAISTHPALSLRLIITGMHLDESHGGTSAEIMSDGFAVAGLVHTELSEDRRSFMARAIGTMLLGFSEILEREQPDIVLLLGDRGEMLAGAIAAIHLNIPVVHIHGGERSGTVDEPVRHAISKMSHYHFTATQNAAERLRKMGEKDSSVFHVGAPGLDGLLDQTLPGRAECFNKVGFSESQPTALMVFHPVVQQAADGARQVSNIFQSLHALNCQILVLNPNADLGRSEIQQVLDNELTHPDVRIFSHLHRTDYLNWLATADVMIGNSSSGIIEAATFGTPVVNVGKRQNLRERNVNVADVEPQVEPVTAAVEHALKQGRYPAVNIYGDGSSAPRIAELLATVSLDTAVLEKCCVY